MPYLLACSSRLSRMLINGVCGCRCAIRSARLSSITPARLSLPRIGARHQIQIYRAFHNTIKQAEQSFAHKIDRSAAGESPRIIPKFQITFTCKACDHRSTHEMTKQAYTKGTVLIQCPACKNRHLIADNLKIFSDTNINIEDILRDQGQLVKKTSLNEGDVEFLSPEDEEDVRLLVGEKPTP